MRTVIVVALLLVAGSARADLRIAATTPDLAALAHTIGGEHAIVTALSLPTQDPHFVDPKPSLVLELNRASMLVVAGLGLEVGWLPTLQTGARNGAILTGGKGYVDCSQHVKILDVAESPLDRSAGDIHPTGNPHYLYDPRQAVGCARAIAERMKKLAPEHAAYFQRNLQTFEAALGAKIKAWEARLASRRGAPVVAYHKSWVYLAAWLGFVIVEHLEPKPGIPPSPSHVVRVIKLAKARGVKVLLQETYYPDRTAKLVADKIGARVVQLPGGADFRHGEGYIEHMEHVVEALERGFR